MIRRPLLPVMVFALAAVAVPAFAQQPPAPKAPTEQHFGIGPRFALVSADPVAPPNAPLSATRFMGGAIRMKSSHVGLEASMDYRSYTSADLTQRTRETPIQGSLLLFLMKAPVSPYLLGGVGLYSQQVDTLTTAGAVTATTTSRKIGWHAGLGAEVSVVRHLGVFVDYRYRFVSFNDPAATPIIASLPVKIGHQGSMWTGGVSFYF